MLILGIDPGLAATGWGIIRAEGGRPLYVDGGIIRTAADSEHIARLDFIRASIDDIALRHRPQIAGVERVFAGAGAKSSMNLGEARGAIVAALLNCGINIMEITALQIKKSITGAGRADKQQVAKMTALLLQNPPPRLRADAADALACALTLQSAARVQDGKISRLPPIRSRARRRARR